MKLKTIFSALVISLMYFTVSAVNISDLSQITDMEGTYELTEDVVLGENFISIGTKDEPFKGKLDGNGHTVTGTYSSIFGYTYCAEIKNINVVNANLKSDMLFGGIAAVAGDRTEIQNCTFEGSVTVDEDGMYAIGGGIAGINKGEIENCFTDVKLNVIKRPYVLSFGGVAGENDGYILYCMSDGVISSDSDKYKVNLGGIAGENNGNGFIDGCFNEANVSGKIISEASQLFIGGIAGVNHESCYIDRCANLAEISGKGIGIYPAYVGGVIGLNANGAVDTVKNTAVIRPVRSFAGGIAGMNISNGAFAYINDSYNTGEIIKHDSITGGITAVNSTVSKNETTAYIRYALNLTSDKAVAKNNAETDEIYNIGAEDGASVSVTAADLKENGIPSLEKHDKIWVNNTEISALPDMLVVRDRSKAQLIVSNTGDDGDIAYYLYSPDASGYAKAFAAVYYNGSRYVSMDYVEKTPYEMYARLKASDIPDGTTRIKFIAFAEAFGTAFKPSEVVSAETEYKK